MYTHHGIYIGNDEVIHYIKDTSGHNKGVVGKTTLKEFVGDRTLGMFRYGVSPQEVLMDLNGTCSSREKDPAEKVVERAKSLLGKGDYNVLTNNCDKNSSFCATGIWESSLQVNARLKVGFPFALLVFILYFLEEEKEAIPDWQQNIFTTDIKKVHLVSKQRLLPSRYSCQ